MPLLKKFWELQNNRIIKRHINQIRRNSENVLCEESNDSSKDNSEKNNVVYKRDIVLNNEILINNNNNVNPVQIEVAQENPTIRRSNRNIVRPVRLIETL